MKGFRMTFTKYCKPIKKNTTVVKNEKKCKDALFKDGRSKPSTDIDFNNNKITNLGPIVEDDHLGSKEYADAIVSGIKYSSFIKSGQSVTINTSRNPNWTYILGTVRFVDQYLPMVIFKNVNKYAYRFVQRGYGANITHDYFGDVKLKNITKTGFQLEPRNFGYYEVGRDDKSFTRKDNDEEYGIQQIIVY